jgi:hypothetical protein
MVHVRNEKRIIPVCRKRKMIIKPAESGLEEPARSVKMRRVETYGYSQRRHARMTGDGCGTRQKWVPLLPVSISVNRELASSICSTRQ